MNWLSSIPIRRFVGVFLLVLVSIGSVPCNEVRAQEVNPAPNASANAGQSSTPAGGDAGTNPFDFKRILTRFEFWLSFLILGFGAIVVAVEFALLRLKDFDGNDILKVFGVTLIVVGTLFLIAAGFGDKQIAPAMGLFGTLAGYLLGRAGSPPVREPPGE